MDNFFIQESIRIENAHLPVKRDPDSLDQASSLAAIGKPDCIGQSQSLDTIQSVNILKKNIESVSQHVLSLRQPLHVLSPTPSVATNLEEILYLHEYKSGPDAPDPYQYIHTIKVVNNQIGSEKIRFFKSKFENVSIPVRFEDILNDEGYLSNENFQTLGMGEYYFLDSTIQATLPLKSYIYTYGIKDCIGLVGFDKETKKAFLYHCSKMELRNNDFGYAPIEKCFIPDFKGFFQNVRPQIYLIGSCYNSDIVLLLEKLQDHGIQFNGFDFPDIFFENQPEIVTEEYKIKHNCTCIYADISAYKYDSLRNEVGLPETRILLDVDQYNITVARR